MAFFNYPGCRMRRAGSVTDRVTEVPTGLPVRGAGAGAYHQSVLCLRRITAALLSGIFLAVLPFFCGSCRLTAFAASSPISISITVNTESGKTVSPRETVPFDLNILNENNPAWLRLKLTTASSGIDKSFGESLVHFDDNWVKCGDYYYYTQIAQRSASVDAINSFTVPDVTSAAEGARLTISVYAEAIGYALVKPDFTLEDPWKGYTGSASASYTSSSGSGGTKYGYGYGPDSSGALSGSGAGSGSGSTSGSTVSSGQTGSASTTASGGSTGGLSALSGLSDSAQGESSLIRYSSPTEGGSISTGKWYLADSLNHLWKYGNEETGSYASGGWYYLKNDYSSNDYKYQWFYFDGFGFMSTGWVNPSGNDWYHMHELSDGNLGALNYGFYTDDQDKRTYYLNEKSGLMESGWQSINGNSYYFAAASEIPAANWAWKLLGGTGFGRWIYNALGLRSYGSMYVNEYTPDGSYVDTSGRKL